LTDTNKTKHTHTYNKQQHNLTKELYTKTTRRHSKATSALNYCRCISTSAFNKILSNSFTENNKWQNIQI